MSSTLLHTDEETDSGVYGAYLRAQADSDLMDIARHLDPERYPAALLTETDATGPSWPTGEMMPDGIPLSAVIRLFSVAILRGTVVWSAYLGFYPLLLLILGGWTMTRAWPVYLNRARADVWRLTTLAFAVLTLAVVLAAGPRSAVPTVFSIPSDAPFWQAALPLVNPFEA